MYMACLGYGGSVLFVFVGGPGLLGGAMDIIFDVGDGVRPVVLDMGDCEGK
jgi:hypothetical protein